VVRDELSKLNSELAAMSADEATTHLTRAVYYERRGLVADAYNEYCAVLQLAPRVEEYRDMLRNLLITVKLYNEIDYLVH
jgi:Flp pilus assembly protein TadD